MTPEQANMLLQQLITYFKGQPPPSDIAFYRRLLIKSKYVPAAKAVHAACRRLNWPTIQELEDDITYGCRVTPPSPTVERRPAVRQVIPAEEGAAWARSVREALRAREAGGGSTTSAAAPGTAPGSPTPSPSTVTS